jgi:hypothetical protein
MNYTKEELKQAMLYGLDKYHDKHPSYRVCSLHGLRDMNIQCQDDDLPVEEIYQEALKEYDYDFWLQEQNGITIPDWLIKQEQDYLDDYLNA